KASRKKWHEKAPNGIVGGMCHRFVSRWSFDPVILPLESDAVLAACDQAAVSDGDAVGVAGEISEHRLGSAERPLGIDHPLGPAQRCEEGGECFGVGACSVVAEEVEAAGLVRGGEHLEKQPAKQP